jgi:hypothetical protein
VRQPNAGARPVASVRVFAGRPFGEQWLAKGAKPRIAWYGRFCVPFGSIGDTLPAKLIGFRSFDLDLGSRENGLRNIPGMEQSMAKP